MFASAIQMATGNKEFNQGNADHDTIKKNYDDVNNSSDLSNKTEQALGMAAATTAFKEFMNSSKGGNQTNLVSMALSKAYELYNSHSSQGGNGNLQNVLAAAVQAALKLFASK
ncbi:hypothetical protein GGI24_000873 [Coemansia furcata]|nr:hypothetical protein GGI24_000873 [Coemansia furcata]